MPETPMPQSQDATCSCQHGSVRVVVVPAGGRQTVWWVLCVLLAIIATALVSQRDQAWLSSQAMAQMAVPGGPPTAGARGIYAFTGQLGVKDYGLFMLDVDTGTVWCYEMARSRDGAFQLQLVAARSWIFDRFLEEFNVAKPTPSEVQLMVRQQRGAAAAAGDLLGTPGNPANDSAVSQPAAPAAPPVFAPALPGSGS